MEAQTLSTFTNRLAGTVILPDSTAYGEVRSIFNRQGSPAVIVRVKNNDDIAAAIQFAHDNDLTLAIRSGGHHLSGIATNNGGLVIDLSHLNSVEVLDADKHLVRIGAGAKWGEVAKALSAHGLAISSGDTASVGVGGLTLGGGVGWLVRKYGLTIDHLEAAELVTANGDTVRVSATEHPDLFWALRGGGGNFGVVTSFDFRAQPVKSIIGGLISYPVAEGESVLKKWATAMRSAPDELSSTIVLFSGFGPQVPAQVMVYAVYAGDDKAAANAAIQPLRELGTVQSDDIETKPYSSMLEALPDFPPVTRISASGFIKTLDDDVIAAAIANYGKAGMPIVQFRSLGGALARIDTDATAFAHRDSEVLFWAAAIIMGAATPEQIDAAATSTWQPLKPFASGAYGNFLSDTSEASITATYPPATYARLANVKATYDPDNVFNQNLNIKPALALEPTGA